MAVKLPVSVACLKQITRGTFELLTCNLTLPSMLASALQGYPGIFYNLNVTASHLSTG